MDDVPRLWESSFPQVYIYGPKCGYLHRYWPCWDLKANKRPSAHQDSVTLLPMYKLRSTYPEEFVRVAHFVHFFLTLCFLLMVDCLCIHDSLYRMSYTILSRSWKESKDSSEDIIWGVRERNWMLASCVSRVIWFGNYRALKRRSELTMSSDQIS